MIIKTRGVRLDSEHRPSGGHIRGHHW